MDSLQAEVYGVFTKGKVGRGKAERSARKPLWDAGLILQRKVRTVTAEQCWQRLFLCGDRRQTLPSLLLLLFPMYFRGDNQNQ